MNRRFGAPIAIRPLRDLSGEYARLYTSHHLHVHVKRSYILVVLSLLVLGLFLTVIASTTSVAKSEVEEPLEFTIDYGEYGIIYQEETADIVLAVGYTGTPVNVDLPSEVEYDGVTYMVGGLINTFLNCNTLETFRGGYGQDWLDVDGFTFYLCTSLRTIEFGPSLRYIYDLALLECPALESYSMPEGSSWNTFFVDDGVLMINENAMVKGAAIYKYPSNKPLAEYHVPDYVDIIISRAFDYGFNLEKVFIHKDVTTIHTGAFHGCVALKAFVVDEANPNYESLDGVLYLKGLNGLLCYPGGMPAKVFMMPDSVTRVLDHAFFGNMYLEEVKFSPNLKYLGFEAFNGSQSLKRVVLPEGVLSVGENCFTLSIKLEYVSLPSSLQGFGNFLFRGCTSLKVVYNASDLQLYSLLFVESKREFTYYKDAAHTILHEDPLAMYGDVYVYQGVPDKPVDYSVPIAVGAVVAIVLATVFLLRFRD